MLTSDQTHHSLAAVALLSVLLTAGARASQPADALGGRVEARVGDQTVVFPSLETAIEADVRGDLATVTVRQTFANPLDRAMHVTYLFPLNQDAAVYEMVMVVGDERVRAEIQRIEEARAIFEQAKSEGKSAALLTQHRPNMFTQDVANLMPGLPIEVTLRYVQTVPRVDGEYELVVPLVVGPRFQPPGAGTAPVQAGADTAVADAAVAGDEAGSDSPRPVAGWEIEALPAYPPAQGLDIPDSVDADRVSIRVRLDGAMPIERVASRSHAIHTAVHAPERREIGLAEGRTIDNRDFVLRYALAGEGPQAGLLVHRDERGGFFSLLIEPPAVPRAQDVTPREMVFVLDTSGSMSGLPLAASRAFMREALRRLRPSDTFRIIRFGDAATEFSSRPLPATPRNVKNGIRYTKTLRGAGGTVMSAGVVQALEVPVPRGAIRLVAFLTDGYIGNEAEVLGLVSRHIGDARLFALGVGAGVNRHLLDAMGRMGRGFTRYMDPTEEPEAVAVELAGRLETPVLTDIEIDWGGLEPRAVMPGRIPDLFAGDSLRVQGRFERAGTHRIEVRGLVNGRRATLPVDVDLSAAGAGGEAVALVWARSAIADAMREITGRGPSAAQKKRVVDLGLEFALATRWTAFVAVSERVYNAEPGEAVHRPVPLPQVAGVTELAYAGGPTAAAPATYTGASTPEPAPLLGLALLGAMVAWQLRRRRAG